MEIINAIWKFCSYLFIPQMGKRRRKYEQLKKDITYIMGKEYAEGNVDTVTPIYISHILHAPLNDVKKAMSEINK